MPVTEAPPAWAAPPRRRRLSKAGRRRLIALGVVAVVGAPAFLIGGRYWVSHLNVEDAVAKFQAAGPAAAVAIPGLPEPGVYQYRTTGGEHISFLDYHRSYSSTTMRIVTRHGCGVREQQWFLIQHIEYYDRCPDGSLASYGTDIAYWWTHGTQTFGCDPGGSFDMTGRHDGERVTWSCRDEDTRAEQVTERIGTEEVVVGGRPMQARHTRWTTTFSGATKGTAVVDDWFDPSTGLVLREKREIGLRVGSPFVGQVGYTDSSEFTLVSLTPRRG